jgi:hypothetical protein
MGSFQSKRRKLCVQLCDYMNQVFYFRLPKDTAERLDLNPNIKDIELTRLVNEISTYLAIRDEFYNVVSSNDKIMCNKEYIKRINIDEELWNNHIMDAESRGCMPGNLGVRFESLRQQYLNLRTDIATNVNVTGQTYTLHFDRGGN